MLFLLLNYICPTLSFFPGMVILSAGHMGLPELALDGEDPFIAVELDTSFDPSLVDVDINGDHIGVDVNTVVSLAIEDFFLQKVYERNWTSAQRALPWLKGRNSSALIELANSYLSKTRPAVNKANKRFVVDTS